MSSSQATAQGADPAEKVPKKQEAVQPGGLEDMQKAVTQKVGNLKGVEALIAYFKKSEILPFVGAFLKIWSEYFGLSKEETKENLQALQETVEKDKSKEDEDVEEGQDEAEEEEKPEVEIKPYKPGNKKPTLSPKTTFRKQIEAIYDRQDTIYTTDNLNEYYGRDYMKFLIEKDPITNEEPITFLGRPISGGINLTMLPFLRIAERNLMDQDLNYIPQQKEVRGFQDRNMCVPDGKGGYMEDPNIPSFHKYGLAVDLDPDHNWPKDGRGTIPDEVILAMAEAGFACGSISRNTEEKRDSFWYLMNDTMHYQLRFPPESAAGQEIINNSPIGKKYWDAVKPMYEEVRQQSV